MRIMLLPDKRNPKERALYQQLQNPAALQKKAVRSPFPFSLLEIAIGAALDKLERGVRRLVCAIIR
jgi:hypothetical protein